MSDRGLDHRPTQGATLDTTFRLTPLMVAILGHYHLVDASFHDAFIGMVRLLLKHGANPFARDMMGRTVVHYATSLYFNKSRSPKGLEMAQLCIDASHLYHKVNKVVTLHGLTRAELNGSTGYCGGYDTETGRLVVYLSTKDGSFKKKPISVKTNNIQVMENTKQCPSNSISKPLVDYENRFGETALQIVSVDGTRSDFTTCFFLTIRTLRFSSEKSIGWSSS